MTNAIGCAAIASARVQNPARYSRCVAFCGPAIFASAWDAEVKGERPGSYHCQPGIAGEKPAVLYASRGFRLTAGERCGDHDVAAYLPQINAMKQKFLHLAAQR